MLRQSINALEPIGQEFNRFNAIYILLNEGSAPRAIENANKFLSQDELLSTFEYKTLNTEARDDIAKSKKFELLKKMITKIDSDFATRLEISLEKLAQFTASSLSLDGMLTQYYKIFFIRLQQLNKLYKIKVRLDEAKLRDPIKTPIDAALAGQLHSAITNANNSLSREPFQDDLRASEIVNARFVKLLKPVIDAFNSATPKSFKKPIILNAPKFQERNEGEDNGESKRRGPTSSIKEIDTTGASNSIKEIDTTGASNQWNWGRGIGGGATGLVCVIVSFACPPAAGTAWFIYALYVIGSIALTALGVYLGGKAGNSTCCVKDGAVVDPERQPLLGSQSAVSSVGESFSHSHARIQKRTESMTPSNGQNKSGESCTLMDSAAGKATDLDANSAILLQRARALNARAASGNTFSGAWNSFCSVFSSNSAAVPSRAMSTTENGYRKT